MVKRNETTIEELEEQLQKKAVTKGGGRKPVRDISAFTPKPYRIQMNTRQTWLPRFEDSDNCQCGR